MGPPEGETLLDLIRDDIRRYGQSVINCDELLLLVSPNDPIAGQYNHIFRTAMKERWSFEFRTDGSVRFVSLDRGAVSPSAHDDSPLQEETGVREA